MAILTILDHGSARKIPFRAEDKPLLDLILTENGITVPHFCGGRGVCGKCAVNVTGALSAPDEAEQRLGKRLACRTRLLGDAVLDLSDRDTAMQIETNETDIPGSDSFLPGDLGVACDIGTTTVALGLYDLRSGRQLAVSSARNPQTAVAADVIGRISAALSGRADMLRELIEKAIRDLTDECLRATGAGCSQIKKTVLTGNTAMLYLLTGRSPKTLSRAPFEADCLFDCDARVAGTAAYLPPCISAFVGADITCAAEAMGMTEKDEISLLCDVGTNGEIALYKEGVLYVASTAAGPAFEGAGISSGCEAVPGAIDSVRFENGAVSWTTIGGEAPLGICGSGIIDASAVFLDAGIIDETGLLVGDSRLSPDVEVTQKDIRQIQLAKAAIAAGIAALTAVAECRWEDIDKFFVAGGFGKHLCAESAVRIGLFPAELKGKMQAVGNAAFLGAARALTDEAARARLGAIRKIAVPVSLGGSKLFNDLYIRNMNF